MKIVAFSGRRYCGKSTCSSIVSDLCDDFREVAFADALRQDYCKLNKLELSDLYKDKERYRKGLIKLSEVRKKKDPAYFAKRLFEGLSDSDCIVISDLRFIEELKEIVDRGGLVLNVQSSYGERSKRGWVYDSLIDNDYSETELDLSRQTYHCLGGDVILNNSSDQDLRKEIFRQLKNNFPDLELNPYRQLRRLGTTY